jgi:phosphopantothenoylcysteine decarboxylase
MARPLTLVVCGAPLASRTVDVANSLVGDGWQVTVVGTPTSAAWFDSGAVAAATGTPARFDYRSPSTPKSRPDPKAVVVCPATFNTVNKAAVGAADTYALGAINEALGMGVPLVVVPMVNNKLWGHPAWQHSLDVLTHAGVVLLDVRTGQRLADAVPSGTGDQVVEAFKPEWIVAALSAIA